MTLSDASLARCMIHVHVSPSIWRRCREVTPKITQYGGISSFDHNKHLRVLARPFRLLELLGEIRNSIYTFAFDERALPLIKLGKRSTAIRVLEALPPVLHASSQIRREALPLFCTGRSFRLLLPRTHTEYSEVAKARQEVTRWISEIVKESNKDFCQIQSLDRMLHVAFIAQCSRITFSKKSGLSISFFQHCLTDGTKWAPAENHVADID